MEFYRVLRRVITAYTLFFQKRHSFYFYDNFVRCRPIWLILKMIIGQSIYNVLVFTRQMSADLADFKNDYRSVNLQRPSIYLLVRNGNLFDSRVPA